MDYTLSNGFVTDAGTGNRMHLQAQAVPTAVSDGDLNGLVWEALSVIRAAGIAPTAFNKATPATYTQLLTALRAAGVFTTPAQFDNTTKVATTAFVQRAVGNLSGVAVMTATGTLAVADLGKFIDVACPSAGQTISLPATASTPAGSLYYIQNEGNPFTLSRTGADVLITDSATSTTHVIGAGGQIVAVSGGGGGWHISGTGVLGKLGDFGSSLGASGYQRLPSGLIIQWGMATTSIGGSTSALPIAFPSSFFAAYATPLESKGGGSITAGATQNGLTAIDLTASAGVSVQFFAIGK